jgi:hypothetical protein
MWVNALTTSLKVRSRLFDPQFGQLGRSDFSTSSKSLCPLQSEEENNTGTWRSNVVFNKQEHWNNFNTHLNDHSVTSFRNTGNVSKFITFTHEMAGKT